MKPISQCWLVIAAAAASIAWTPPPSKREYRLLDLDSADFRVQQFAHRRDPYTPGYDESWKYRAALDWRVSILKYGFWDNSVHTEGLDDGRVKTVGWHWFLGVHVPPLHLDLFHEHHSQHVMDERPLQRDGDDLESGYRKFPLEDSYGVRFNLYRRAGRDY